MRVGLVACAAQKRSEPSAAKDLYTSPLFRKARAYCDANYDRWFILSAKYGLLDPEEVIKPYNVTLNAMPAYQRKAWAADVCASLAKRYFIGDEFYFHAGRHYYEYLLFNPLRGTVPLAGLGIGQQLAWYKERGF